MSSRIFISLAIDDVYNITIIQQCKMLEASLATDVVDQCLATPDYAPKIVRDNKEPLLKRDYELLLICNVSSFHELCKLKLLSLFPGGKSGTMLLIMV